MNSKEYYRELNEQTKNVFRTSEENDLLGTVHNLVITLNDWSEIIDSVEAKSLIHNSIEQIDISCLLMLNGLYRASFTSLRLSLEMITSSIYFSTNNLEYREWKQGGYDIKWSVITDIDNGILSQRFTNIYLPEAKKISKKYLTKLKQLYRELSEMVHGNFYTWNFRKKEIIEDKEKINTYFENIETLNVLSNYMFSVRFLNDLNDEKKSTIETHIMDCLEHEDILRTKFGGTK